MNKAKTDRNERSKKKDFDLRIILSFSSKILMAFRFVFKRSGKKVWENIKINISTLKTLIFFFWRKEELNRTTFFLRKEKLSNAIEWNAQLRTRSNGNKQGNTLNNCVYENDQPHTRVHTVNDQNFYFPGDQIVYDASPEHIHI